MNILKRYRLKKQQRALMQEHDIYKDLQSKHSKDEYFREYTQRKMDVLTEKCEHIRCILDGRWDE